MLHSAPSFTALDDAQAVTEGSQMPETVPQAVKDKVLPPEQLSLTAFIDFRLPPCSTSGSELEIYFTMLSPEHDIPLIPTVTDALRILSPPPPSVVHQLSLRAPTAWESGNRSIVYAHTDDPCRFPFWILPLWRAIAELRSSQLQWSAARQFVLQLATSHSEAAAFHAHMDTLAWSGTVHIERLRDWTPVKDLCQFAS